MLKSFCIIFLDNLQIHYTGLLARPLESFRTCFYARTGHKRQVAGVELMLITPCQFGQIGNSDDLLERNLNDNFNQR